VNSRSREVSAPAAAPSLLDETYENYRAYLNPPLARLMKLSGSPVEVRAAGVTIVDADGREYLDFAGGYGVFTLGHRHPRVVAAVQAQLDAMALSGRTMFNPLMGRLAKRLAELTPGDLQISFFSNSGAEAVEAALKLARAATARTRIVATHGAYHGKTLGALSVSRTVRTAARRRRARAVRRPRRARRCAGRRGGGNRGTGAGRRRRARAAARVSGGHSRALRSFGRALRRR
jgi:4-aminobutyrate aminotransferase-like enzyme